MMRAGKHGGKEIKKKCVCVCVPYNSFYGAHQLLSTTLPCVDGRGRGLVEMGLCCSPHLTAVVVDMATLAVADRPVSMAPTAAG